MLLKGIDLPRLLFEMALFAALGLGFEVIFTSVLDFKKDRRCFLMGYSSLWYAPLYALVPLFLNLTNGWLFRLPFWERGVVYALVVFIVEYVGMLCLRMLLGASPSQESYYKSPWNVHGLIRLDYFPAMWLMGLAFEVVFRYVR